jgi:hypothetical protein
MQNRKESARVMLRLLQLLLVAPSAAAPACVLVRLLRPACCYVSACYTCCACPRGLHAPAIAFRLMKHLL